MNPPQKPEFTVSAPEKQIYSRKEITREHYSDNEYIIEETDTHIKVLNFELDYGSCYYECDNPTIVTDIITYEKGFIPNPQYKAEMYQYNQMRKSYEKAMIRYEKRLEKFKEKTQNNNVYEH